MPAATDFRNHHIDLRHAALVGALAVAVLVLLLWATAAADVLPAYAPQVLLGFRPSSGIARLVAGLFCAALAGAALALVLAGTYNVIRGGPRQPGRPG